MIAFRPPIVATSSCEVVTRRLSVFGIGLGESVGERLIMHAVRILIDLEAIHGWSTREHHSIDLRIRNLQFTV